VKVRSLMVRERPRGGLDVSVDPVVLESPEGSDEIQQHLLVVVAAPTGGEHEVEGRPANSLTVPLDVGDPGAKQLSQGRLMGSTEYTASQ